MQQLLDRIFHFARSRGDRDRCLTAHGDGLVDRHEVRTRLRHQSEDAREHTRLVVQHEVERNDAVGRRLEKGSDAVLVFIVSAARQACELCGLACCCSLTRGDRLIGLDHALKYLGQQRSFDQIVFGFNHALICPS